jgi:hypothetical protein
VLPLDTFTETPAAVMAVVGETVRLPCGSSGRHRRRRRQAVRIESIERFAFYERAKAAFAVVATGERFYGNIIVVKGSSRPPDLTAAGLHRRPGLALDVELGNVFRRLSTFGLCCTRCTARRSAG